MASAGISNYSYTKSSYSTPSDSMSSYRRPSLKSYISPAERSSLTRNNYATTYASPRSRDTSASKSPMPFLSTYASSYNTYPSSSSSSSRTLPVLDGIRRTTYTVPSYGTSRTYTDRSQNGASSRYGTERLEATDSNVSSRVSRLDSQSKTRPLKAVDNFKV